MKCGAKFIILINLIFWSKSYNTGKTVLRHPKSKKHYTG